MTRSQYNPEATKNLQALTPDSTAEQVARLLAQGADPRGDGMPHVPPLEAAGARVDARAVELLIAQMIKDAPLGLEEMFATAQWVINSAKEETRKEAADIFRQLTAQSWDINMILWERCTPLTLACKAKRPGAIGALLDAGARADLFDGLVRMPYDMAEGLGSIREEIAAAAERQQLSQNTKNPDAPKPRPLSRL